MVEVEWTGCYPNLCSGNWIIKYNNKELEIPKSRINKTMETYKKYDTWSFGDSWETEWEEYEDGLKKEEWIEANKNWVNSMFKKENIEVTGNLLSELYEKINAEDFRINS